MSALRHLSHGLTVELGPRFCAVRLDEPHASTGFPLVGGALATTRLVVIHEVRNADLPEDRDPLDHARMLQRDRLGEDGLVLLTSRSLEDVDVREATSSDVLATAVATVGLGNALRVGDSPGPIVLPGTINLVVRASVPLTLEARREALSLLAEARTTAVLEARVASRRSFAVATGTGTDALVLLTPLAGAQHAYAGKHTDLGSAIGQAAWLAVTDGIARWRREIEPTLPEALRGGPR